MHSHGSAVAVSVINSFTTSDSRRFSNVKNYTLQRFTYLSSRKTQVSVVLDVPISGKTGKEAPDPTKEESVLCQSFLLYNVFDSVFLFKHDANPFKNQLVFEKQIKFFEHPCCHSMCEFPSSMNVSVDSNSPRPLLASIIGFQTGDLLYLELPGRNRQHQFNEAGSCVKGKVMGVLWLPCRDKRLRFLAWFDVGKCIVVDASAQDRSVSSLAASSSSSSSSQTSEELKLNFPDATSLVGFECAVNEADARNPVALWTVSPPNSLFHSISVARRFSPSKSSAPSPSPSFAACVGKWLLVGIFLNDSCTLVEIRKRFLSYFGDYLCCSWSHDNAFIAVGGQADTVSIIDPHAGTYLAYGSCHRSWIASLDWSVPQKREGGGREGEDADVDSENVERQQKQYRLVSASTDTSFVPWTFTPPDPQIRPPQSSPFNEPDTNTKGIVHHPPPRLLHTASVLVPRGVPQHLSRDPLSVISVDDSGVLTAASGGDVCYWSVCGLDDEDDDFGGGSNRECDFEIVDRVRSVGRNYSASGGGGGGDSKSDVSTWESLCEQKNWNQPASDPVNPTATAAAELARSRRSSHTDSESSESPANSKKDDHENDKKESGKSEKVDSKGKSKRKNADVVMKDDAEMKNEEKNEEKEEKEYEII